MNIHNFNLNCLVIINAETRRKMDSRLDTQDRELYHYSTQYKSTNRLSDRLIEKMADIFSHGGRFNEYGFLKLINAMRMLVYSIAAIVADSTETRKKRKTLQKILGCKEAELAVDINEFIDRQNHTKYYGSDFKYSAVTKKAWLKKLTLIFGDAHLEALDEMSCLALLESIWGNVYFSRCTDLSGLMLKHIGGDLHGEKLMSAEGLKQLEFVGGTIYFQNRQFDTLEEFKLFVTI